MRQQPIGVLPCYNNLFTYRQTGGIPTLLIPYLDSFSTVYIIIEHMLQNTWRILAARMDLQTDTPFLHMTPISTRSRENTQYTRRLLRFTYNS